MRGAAALQDLLTELAVTLLPRGMTPRRFAELARSAFVQAAADISRLRNGKVNHSRVAAQTGLSRADVKRLLRQNAFELARRGQTAIERVIDGWRTDRWFATSGHPRRLQISGSRRSFAALVRKYGGDVPHKAVLVELRRIGAVTDINGDVQLRASLHLRHRNDFAFLAPVLPALIDSLRIANRHDSNAGAAIRRLSLSAESEMDSAIIRDRCTSSAQSMLEGLAHSLGPQVTRPRSGKSHAHWFTVTVLVAENRGKRTQGA
jgi:hypothetical protein